MTSSARTACQNLADDLGWLEQHAHDQPATAGHAVPLRFAAALVRNLVGPYLDGIPVPPLHLVVVGGAGTGKSTVANLLCGATVAEANPQAGFTRHPIAYTRSGDDSTWANLAGSLEELRLLSAPSPSSLDEDVFQIRTVPVEADTGLLERFVVWDCPDMTTWAASGYAPRLLEVAAMGDVIIYVASDERYNDAVPTAFLKLFLGAGKPVVVVLTKMQAENATAFIEHFQREVLVKVPRGRVAVLAVPHLTTDELADLTTKAAGYRIPLVNQVAVLGDPPAGLRKHTVNAAVAHLRINHDNLVAVARDDLAALDEWSKLIRFGEAEFEDRYRREYLATAKFHRFDEALVRLIDLLELPGVGKFLASALYVVRTPYRLIKGLLGQMFAVPQAPSIPEQPVLESAFTAWVDSVRAKAVALEKQHDLWARVSQGFDEGLDNKLRELFQSCLRNFQASQTEEIDHTARAIYEDLEKSPGKLNTLRGSKFALDVAAIAGSIVMGGVHLHDVFLVPLAAAMSQMLVEWTGAGYVESQREKARQRQQNLVVKHVAQPIAGFLAQWPATGGTPYERLQLALSRIPTSLAEIENAVHTER